MGPSRTARSGPAPDPLDYPFDVPEGSYVWSAGAVVALPVVAAGTGGRTPILAIGSNGAPSQLTRKFSVAPFTDASSVESLIPVDVVAFRDIDVVHAAHVALYGSVPATVIRAPGAIAHIHVTWLTDTQLDRMNETEGLGRRHYLCELPPTSGLVGGYGRPWCYASTAGALTLGGSPVGLAAVRVEGSTLGRVTQRGIWDLLAAASGLATSGSVLAREVGGNEAVRRDLARFLTVEAIPDGLGGQRLDNHSSMSRIISQTSTSKPLCGPS